MVRKPLVHLCVLLFCLLASHFAGAQTREGRKVLDAHRLEGSLKVDGVLDELVWQEAPVASDFTQNDPNPGGSPSQRTEVRILYDDEALYIGARMYDTEPDRILNQLTNRDELGNTDYFTIVFSCFQDGINGFDFTVTPSGVQFDAQITVFGYDELWNAVWQCNTSMDDDGWVAEFKIPYSALRFPDKENQEWDVNFGRYIRRIRELNYWQPVDPEVEGLVNQSGVLRNLKSIRPPVRLFLYPYAIAYGEIDRNADGSFRTGSRLTGGMDLKYGINDAFTLDMALIPDFGQVRSDNRVLNLTPFEVFFEEQRQFFTEGTELFNKGELFYSRRVGGTPVNLGKAFEELGEGERLVQLPFESQLLNATKISGRNKDGLGLGFFNAVTAPTFARIEGAGGQTREVEIAPLSNYNILVADQNLGNNSYVTLINTSVIRDGATYDANVTGTEFDIRDEENSISIFGGAAYSHKFNYDPKENDGFRYNLGIQKIKGKWVYGIEHDVMSEHYDHNDMGFLTNANYMSTTGSIGYRKFTPFWFLNRFRSTLFFNYDQIYIPNTFANASVYNSTFFTTKSFDTFNLEGGAEPAGTFDYFEARVDGRYFFRPNSYYYGGWFSSDYRRVIALDVGAYDLVYPGHSWRQIDWYVSPRIRFSDRLMFVHRYSRQDALGEVGFTDIASNGDIIFGERDRISHTNLFTINYIFTNRMGLSFRLRHYWSTVAYERFGVLEDDGNLSEAISSWEGGGGSTEGFAGTGSTRDRSYNAFNIDMIYTWVFSPGSELRIVWKNAIEDDDTVLPNDYFDNLNRTLGLAQTNSLSVRFLYFIDYLNLTRKGKFIEN